MINVLSNALTIAFATVFPIGFWGFKRELHSVLIVVTDRKPSSNKVLTSKSFKLLLGAI